jgi:cytochrome c biogenesis protein CcdA
MRDTGFPRLQPRLRRLLSIAGHSVVLVVCLGLLAGWTVRMARHIRQWVHEPAVPQFGAVEVVYFYEPGCPACLRARPFLERLQRRYPRYRWARVDLSYRRGMELAEAYYLHARVPVRDRGTIPVVFAGLRPFIGYLQIHDALPPYLERTPLAAPAAASGAGAPRKAPAVPAASIRERFMAFRLAPVLLAGLIDSVNPCAIATLIFFLSYLALSARRQGGDPRGTLHRLTPPTALRAVPPPRRGEGNAPPDVSAAGGYPARPRDLLGVGAAFTAGVFLTYFLIGLGLLRVLHAFPVTTTLARWIYPCAGLLTLGLAGISFRDYLAARRGQTGAMTLQMPKPLKRWTHQAIRARMGSSTPSGAGRLAIAAFATAVIVSALEFTCTSQVYLPTLMYMNQVEGQRLRATWLLLLYNAMFVAPLVVLFTLAALGASSRSLGAFFVRRTAAIKLAMTFLLAGFSLYMLVIGARILRPL